MSANRSIDLSRLYRAYVSPPSPFRPELAVFADASSRDLAHRHICELVALITRRNVDDVADALYNLCSARELIDEGLSEAPELRLFECHWSGNRIFYIDAPLCLVTDPQPLLDAWQRAVSTQSSTAGAPITLSAGGVPCAV